MRKHHFPGWFKLTSIFTFLILCGIFIIHLILNSTSFQTEIKDYIKQEFDIHLSWNKILFNGATGRFSGDKISVRIPKSETTIILKKFDLIFNPLKIPFQQIDFIELNAENLIIEHKQSSKALSSSSSIRKSLKLPQNQIKKAENLAGILKHFHIRKGNIKNINVSISDQLELSISQVNVKAKNPFLFYKEAGDIILDDIKLISSKFDLFSKKLTVTGSYNLFSENDFFYPQGDGVIRADDLLMGFNKKPLDWNPHPGFSDKLEPLLNQKYDNNIPTNRSFAYTNELTLPLQIDPDIVEISNGTILAFNSIIKLRTKWERQAGPFSLRINTSIPASVDLLPLGKARLRDAFEEMSLDLKIDGNLYNLSKNNLDSHLKINFLKNKHVPDFPNLKISSSLKIKDGIINSDDIKAVLKDGTLNAKAKVDLNNMKLSSSIEAQKINLQTVVRLFSTIDLPGTVDGKGTISGEILNPNFDIDLKASDFGYESLYLGDIYGKLKIKNHHLTLQASNSLGQTGSGKWNLDIKEVFRSSLQTLKLNIETNSLPLSKMMKSEIIRGDFSGDLKFEKHLGDYKGNGTLIGKDITWYDVPINFAEFNLDIDDRDLYITPKNLIFNEDFKITKNIPKTKISFTPYKGYEISGWILPNTSIQGKFNELISDRLFLVFESNQENLIFLDLWFKEDLTSFNTSSTLNLEYYFQNPTHSKFSGLISKLKVSSPNKSLESLRPASFKAQDQVIHIDKGNILLGSKELFLDGIYSFNIDKPISNLKIKGALDLSQFQDTFDWFNEGNGISEIDLLFKGSHENLLLYGYIKFNDNQILLSSLKGDLDHLKGSIKLEGEKYYFNDFSGQFDDAKVELNGWLEIENFNHISSADLSIKTNEFYLNKTDTWNLLTNADLHMLGEKDQVFLKGDLNIIEGVYFKNYESADFLLKPVGVIYAEDKNLIPEMFQSLNLDLKAKTQGEIEVKNNVANLILTCDLDLDGPIDNPIAQGVINIEDGEINALGISFTNANGFASYEKSPIFNPYINFEATRDIQDFEVKSIIEGYASNLQLKFSSTPSLAQNDIISLVAFGRTPDQLSDDKQRIFSRTAVASQVLSMIGKPLSKATKLDIVKLETEDNRNFGETTSTFAIGKTFSPRFSLSLITDIGDTDAISGISFEYLILDELLIKGTKDIGSRYRFDLTWRFIGY